MTLWLADADVSANGLPTAVFAPAEPDLAVYRTAVGDLAAELRQGGGLDSRSTESILARRLDAAPFADVLSGSPDGRDATIARLLFEVRNYEPSSQASRGIPALVRISLLTQIDLLWWGASPGYRTDADVLDSGQLIDLDELYFAGQLRFSYRHQAVSLVSRALRSAERRALPGRSPRTAGLWMARGMPQLVCWLNQLAEEFAAVAPPGTPALWVTSLARSIDHQRHLQSLGYVAPLPSAHCVGIAADIEMTWFRRFHAHRLLRGLLLDRQRANEVNVIDEGQAWHVCLRPEVITDPRRI